MVTSAVMMCPAIDFMVHPLLVRPNLLQRSSCLVGPPNHNHRSNQAAPRAAYEGTWSGPTIYSSPFAHRLVSCSSRRVRRFRNSNPALLFSSSGTRSLQKVLDSLTPYNNKVTIHFFGNRSSFRSGTMASRAEESAQESE